MREGCLISYAYLACEIEQVLQECILGNKWLFCVVFYPRLVVSFFHIPLARSAGEDKSRTNMFYMQPEHRSLAGELRLAIS